MNDSAIACFEAKYHYWPIRPVQLDPSVEPLFATANHPSYPAVVVCTTTAAAIVLGHLFPFRAAELDAIATEARNSRVWGLVHFRSDVDAGAEIGRKVGQVVIARARQDE